MIGLALSARLKSCPGYKAFGNCLLHFSHVELIRFIGKKLAMELAYGAWTGRSTPQPAGRPALHGCWASALHGCWAGATAGCGKRAVGGGQSRLSVGGLKPNVDRIGFIGPAEVAPWLQSHWELPPAFLTCRAYPVYWEEVGDGPGLRSVDREVHATAGREAGATRLLGQRATRLLGRRYSRLRKKGCWGGAIAIERRGAKAQR